MNSEPLLKTLQPLIYAKLMEELGAQIFQTFTNGEKVHFPTVNLVLKSMHLQEVSFDKEDLVLEVDGFLTLTPEAKVRLEARKDNPFYKPGEHFTTKDYSGNLWMVIAVEKLDGTGRAGMRTVHYKEDKAIYGDAEIFEPNVLKERFPYFESDLAKAFHAQQ